MLATLLCLALAVADVALASPVVDAPREAPFLLENVVACRGESAGVPVDVGDAFPEGDRAVRVWFGGEAGSRPTPLTAVVWREDPAHVVVQRALSVPAGSDGGVVSLSLTRGSPLPAGRYRVEISDGSRTRSVRFGIVRGIEPAWYGTEDGFALAAPPSWRPLTVDGTAIALARAGSPAATVVVVVRHEPAPVSAAMVAARMVAAMGDAGTGYRVERSAQVEHDGRTVALIWVSCPDGARSKVAVIPREAGATTRTFFGLIVSAEAEDFAAVEAEFDAMVRGFRVPPPRLP